jgi:hypothetical protein
MYLAGNHANYAMVPRLLSFAQPYKNDTLRRPQARDKVFYVIPETHVTSRGVERSGAPREVTWVKGGT